MSAIEINAEHMGGDLLAAMVDELRLLPKPWQSLPEDEQAEVIERLRKRVSHNVRQAVAGIAAGGRIAVAAKVDSMQLAKVCKVTLTVEGARARHDLLDALGTGVVVVLANMESYLAGIGDVRPDDDQTGLDLEGAADNVIKNAKRKPSAS